MAFLSSTRTVVTISSSSSIPCSSSRSRSRSSGSDRLDCVATGPRTSSSRKPQSPFAFSQPARAPPLRGNPYLPGGSQIVHLSAPVVHKPSSAPVPPCPVIWNAYTHQWVRRLRPPVMLVPVAPLKPPVTAPVTPVSRFGDDPTRRSRHGLSAEVFLTCHFSTRSPEIHPLGCI
jgi:hypothetical protein